MDIKNFKIVTVDEETEKKLIGIQGKFLKGEKRQLFLTSKLVEHTISLYKNSGHSFTQEETDKIRFAYDPLYRKKIIEKIHQDSDKEYYVSVSKSESVVKSLEKAKAKEIQRIENSRWENIYGNTLKYNQTEGKLMINGSIAFFCDIKGAEVKINESQRIVTNENGTQKRQASMSGAVIGGLMFGVAGAAIGSAALSKKNHSTNTVTDTVATANRVSVLVDVNGFKNEVILLNNEVKQDSIEFKEAILKAQEIISKLQYLSTSPIYSSYLKVEEEFSVVNLQNQLNEAYNILNQAKANVPTYEIPSYYLIEGLNDNYFSQTTSKTIIDKDYACSPCSNCGSTVKPTDKFCWKCGYKL